jgi:homoserine kinase type II
MALYVTFEADELAPLCRRFALGTLRAFEGIPAGSINTNYRVETDRGRFFLRHTGVRSPEDLTFEAGLLEHLQESAFPAPHILRTVDGAAFVPAKNGFLSAFTYVVGEELGRREVTATHIESLGAELGKLHRVTNAFSGDRQNPYRPEVVASWLDGLAQRAEPDLVEVARELRERLEESVASSSALVPRGILHADLFMDNVKWVGERVSAFFDFEMACRDPYTLDVAITLNAWCFEGEYRPELCAALMRGYQRERALSGPERADLYPRALFGAIRYTASRIRDFHLSPLPPDRLVRKDFRTYLARVRALVAMGPVGFGSLLRL